jgi:hypothetical protein
MYTPFVPPSELRAPKGKKPREWSLAEAKANYDWVLSVQTERVASFLQHLGMSLQW